MSCANNDIQDIRDDRSQITQDDSERICQNCQNKNQFWSKSITTDDQSKNNFNGKSSNPYKSEQLIINTNFTTSNKEIKIMKDNSYQNNESFSLSVVYKNFETEEKGKKIYFFVDY